MQSYIQLSELPFVSFILKHIKDYPTPKTINYFWSFGSLLGLLMAIQILTGVFLAMHYSTHTDYAFNSVEHIMRDVQYGFFLRYLHSNGASFLFMLLYIHLFRGLFYSSFQGNLLTWFSGLVLFLLLMGTAFLGYVLPWGQMSFWGATVITNLASAIPYIGKDVVEWLWGGFSVDNATLNRFFSLHYLLPFLILAMVVIHLSFLHKKGSSNPLGLLSKGVKIKFFPYFYVKDLFSLFVLLFFFLGVVTIAPNVLGHTDNYIVANPMVTPVHIVPEWYFLPFYAILRSIPNKLFGVIGMLSAILFYFIFPLVKSHPVKSSRFRCLYTFVFWMFINIFILLGWIGQKGAVSPFIEIGQMMTLLYFMSLFILSFVLPLLENFFLNNTKEEKI